jgi:cytochrome c-type protein NapC
VNFTAKRSLNAFAPDGLRATGPKQASRPRLGWHKVCIPTRDIRLHDGVTIVAKKQSLTRRIVVLLIVLGLVVPAAIGAAWVGTETMIEGTSDAEFCTHCHTMEPLATAHRRDVHGGDNPSGLVAECNDCHLPHDSPTHHLIAKGLAGLRDAWAQAIYPIHKPDWIGNLEEREEWVYDSGCLACHSALERATTDNPAAAAAHASYFAERRPADATAGPDSCVDCHAHVGHEDLRNALQSYFDEVPDAPHQLVPSEADAGAEQGSAAAGASGPAADEQADADAETFN